MSRKKEGANFFHLVGFEFRKSFGNWIMLAILVGFLVFNGWKASSVWQEESDLNGPNFLQTYRSYFEQFGGTITAEKIQNLLNIYEPLEKLFNTNQTSTEYSPDAYTYSTASDEIFFSHLLCG